MSEIAEILDRNGHKYYETKQYLSDMKILNELHWSDYAEGYFDYGYHTDAVVLKRPKAPPSRTHTTPNLEKVRVVLRNPEYRLVDSTFGYVSLFPFLLQILEPDSPELNKTLIDIKNRELIWTDYGLRSLAKNAPLYMKRNTEHDPPYWRGQIWVNVNFLAVRALYNYAKMEGPYQSLASEIYGELRKNLINNIYKQYKLTGYIWEHYSDKTGEGLGSRPFTGWSALVVLLMGEHF